MLFHLQPPNTRCQREGKQRGPRHQLPGSCPLPPEAWKKELKDLASQVVTFSKENELKNKEVGAEQRGCLGRDQWAQPFVRKPRPSLANLICRRASVCSALLSAQGWGGNKYGGRVEKCRKGS